MPKEKSAGAIIFRKEDGKRYYLLLHYKAGHWDFVKGHVEKGESEKETVRRETEEETGIKDLRFVKGFKKWMKYYFKKSYGKKKGSLVMKIVDFYLAETKTKKIKLSFEHKGFKWLPFEEALKLTTFKKGKDILKEAHEFLTKS